MADLSDDERAWRQERHDRRMRLMRMQGSIGRQQRSADNLMIFAAVLVVIALVLSLVF